MIFIFKSLDLSNTFPKSIRELEQFWQSLIPKPLLEKVAAKSYFSKTQKER